MRRGSGGIIHEAKSESKGTPEIISSDHTDLGNIVGFSEHWNLLFEHKGRYLCFRVFVDLPDYYVYSII